MARKSQAGHTLDEMAHASDRLADWLSRNAIVWLGLLVAALVVASGLIFAMSRAEGVETRAAEALAEVRGAYFTAMGASPGDVTVPEPANPETARRLRGQYVERFREVATAHPDTAAGALALLHAGNLQAEMGEREAALATWRAGLEELAADDPLRGFFLRRIAAAHEAEGAWSEAAQSYEEAGGVAAYPQRFAALADAARAWVEAGETERALAAFDRLEAEAPDHRVPPYVAARLRELRMLRAQP